MKLLKEASVFPRKPKSFRLQTAYDRHGLIEWHPRISVWITLNWVFFFFFFNDRTKLWGFSREKKLNCIKIWVAFGYCVPCVAFFAFFFPKCVSGIVRCPWTVILGLWIVPNAWTVTFKIFFLLFSVFSKINSIQTNP